MSDEQVAEIRLKVALAVINKMVQMEVHRPEAICSLINAVCDTVLIKKVEQKK